MLHATSLTREVQRATSLTHEVQRATSLTHEVQHATSLTHEVQRAISLTHEVQCATYRSSFGAIFEPLGEAEVDELDVPVLVQQQVLHLQVAVDDARVVQEI